MAEVTMYKCDECGKLRSESNHWFRAVTPESGFIISAWEDTIVGPGETELHLCGMECAHKAMARALDDSTSDGKDSDATR